MSETQTSATLNPADKPLDKMTVKELRELASTQYPQIKGISSLNKAPLIEAIQEAMGAPAAPAAAPKAAAPKAPAKKTKEATPKAKLVRLPAFAADQCAASTPAGKAKAEIQFLRSFMAENSDKAARTAARKQMKRLKKRTRRMGAAPALAASEE
ncbi:hypothetical protein N1030_15475 [Desulfovibrio mangrovi]|uniref:hypothetical protein n=1 Tax=Desulfovibrio mangrovi TaxID=2976983 RepID=UPI0022456E27|nr:hypothetical protein [Desulfovibrio mangrovi]UZP66990.1 hypothetical protein N1030_15475 [Desulfovibrio mangrovi]